MRSSPGRIARRNAQRTAGLPPMVWTITRKPGPNAVCEACTLPLALGHLAIILEDGGTRRTFHEDCLLQALGRAADA